MLVGAILSRNVDFLALLNREVYQKRLEEVAANIRNAVL